MANRMYSTFKTAMLDGSAPDLSSVDIKAVLVDAADYTLDIDADEFLSDIAAGARVDTSANLANKTFNVVANVLTFDADNVTFASAAGDPSEYVVLYVDTTVAATSRLICIIDTATGLPATPTGTDITVTWASTGIFTL